MIIDLMTVEMNTPEGNRVRLFTRDVQEIRQRVSEWRGYPDMQQMMQDALRREMEPVSERMRARLQRTGYEGPLPAREHEAMDLDCKREWQQQPPTPLQIALLTALGALTANAFGEAEVLERAQNRWEAGCLIKDWLEQRGGDLLWFM